MHLNETVELSLAV